MAGILHFIALALSCSFLFFPSNSNPVPQSHHSDISNPPKPINLLVLPVQQDASTGLHWANLQKRTPLTQLPLLVDLNGNHLWLNCEHHYFSKTYQAPFCHSTQCSRANTHQCLTCPAASRPGCHKNTCGLISTNPVTQQTGLGELGQDVLAIRAAQGPQLGPLVTVPHFLFSCAPSFLAQTGLPRNTQGVAGLGHGPISLPNQLASHFGLQRQFSTCFSRFPASTGAVIFGDAATNMPRFHNQDIFHDMAFIPLTVSAQGEYNVRIHSIKIAEQPLRLPPPPASSDDTAAGGIMISTSTPNMVLQSLIFEAFTEKFAHQIPNEVRVNAVAPFALCVNSNKVSAFPNVDFVMDRPNGPVWRFSGEDLMVQARAGVKCLAVMNGGMQSRAAITIGARQLEEKLLVFDLARSRLGFSTTALRSRGLKCAHLFNFPNA